MKLFGSHKHKKETRKTAGRKSTQKPAGTDAIQEYTDTKEQRISAGQETHQTAAVNRDTPKPKTAEDILKATLNKNIQIPPDIESILKTAAGKNIRIPEEIENIIVSAIEEEVQKTADKGKRQQPASTKDGQRTTGNEYRPNTTGRRTGQKPKRRSTGKKVLVTCIVLLFLTAAGFSAWYFWQTTNTTFDYKLQPVVVLEGQRVSPDDFLYPVDYMEEVTADYRSRGFRPTSGRQSVPLILTLGRRTVEATAFLYVLKPVDNIRVEFAADAPDLKPSDFLTNADIARGVAFDLSFVTEPMPLKEYSVGQHPVQLLFNETEFEVMLYVEDTTPPTAELVHKTIPMSESVFPGDFVTDIFDESPITSVVFITEPDVFQAGDQLVEIAVEDLYGNRGTFISLLTVIKNEIPPVIEGTRTIESMLGNPIMYRQGVTATDAFGRTLEFEVDSSGVDQNKTGTYKVTYRVEDCCGLRDEVEVTVYVVNVDPDLVNERVDAILEGIINDNMTQVEKVQAIHSWIRRNVSYTGTIGGPQSAYEGAHRALQDRSGNCFIYYSIGEVMLTRAGIPNMRIERKPGTPTRHRWNLINPDDLGWHHFDAMPTRLGNINRLMYMFTDSQAANFARQLLGSNNIGDFYTYVPELYPEVVQ